MLFRAHKLKVLTNVTVVVVVCKVLRWCWLIALLTPSSSHQATEFIEGTIVAEGESRSHKFNDLIEVTIVITVILSRGLK
jgi:hypothetical protein